MGGGKGGNQLKLKEFQWSWLARHRSRPSISFMKLACCFLFFFSSSILFLLLPSNKAVAAFVWLEWRREVNLFNCWLVGGATLPRRELISWNAFTPSTLLAFCCSWREEESWLIDGGKEISWLIEFGGKTTHNQQLATRAAEWRAGKQINNQLLFSAATPKKSFNFDLMKEN